MPLLSEIARNKKIEHFLKPIKSGSRVLEIGSGDGWVKKYFMSRRDIEYLNIDIVPPADVVGDIKKWKEIGLEEGSFDYIIAFEVLEHVDCVEDCYDLLASNGKLLVTTPVPCLDWALQILEFLGLNQKRTSPHNDLLYIKKISFFNQKNIKYVGLLSQWGIFTKEKRQTVKAR